MPLKHQPCCLLCFDRGPIFGSRQHYFHFLLGYLLPGLHAAMYRGDTAENWDQLIFASCGPVMDHRIGEACSLLGLRHQIAAEIKPDASGRPPGIAVNVPRWDAWLRLGRPDQRSAGSWKTLLQSTVAVAMNQIRSRFLEAAGATPGERGPWLLLRRSDPHPFYGAGGAAEIPSYGAGRRSIANLDELAQQLQQADVPVQVYEPGVADFADQIRSFHRARGVIGVRGAEMANQIWMQPGRRVVMLATPIQKENYASWNLSRFRELGFRQLHLPTKHPRLAASQILELVRSGD